MVCATAFKAVSQGPSSGVQVKRALAGSDIELCSGEVKTLGTPPLKNHQYYWQPAKGLDNPRLAQPRLQLEQQGPRPDTLFYTLRVVKGRQVWHDTLRVVLWPRPQAGLWAADTAVCEGEQVAFMARGGQQYIWDWGNAGYRGGLISSAASSRHRFDQSGEHHIRLAAINEGGCSDTVSVRIRVHPRPRPDWRVEKPCLGDTTRLVDVSSIQSGAIVQRTWRLGDTISKEAVFSHFFERAGTYPLQLEVVSDQGCRGLRSHPLRIELPPAPPRALPDTLCVGQQAELQAIGQEGTRYAWYRHPAAQQAAATGPRLRTPPLAHDTTLFLQAISPAGCTSNFVPVTAFVQSPQSMHILSSSQEVWLPDATVEFRVAGMWPLSSWQWQLGDGTSSSLPAPIHTYRQAGVYTIRAEVVSSLGCRLSLEHQLEVKAAAGISLPPAFSPNGDGTNDSLYIRHFAIADFHLRIYNLQGELVYESRQPEQAWDGRDLNGVPVQAGLYLVKITARSQSGEPLLKEQRLTVIR